MNLKKFSNKELKDLKNILDTNKIKFTFLSKWENWSHHKDKINKNWAAIYLFTVVDKDIFLYIHLVKKNKWLIDGIVFEKLEYNPKNCYGEINKKSTP